MIKEAYKLDNCDDIRRKLHGYIPLYLNTRKYKQLNESIDRLNNFINNLKQLNT
jgi:hypothetical protein